HYQARCPAHNDSNPSLDITEKDGKTLVICRAGCEQTAVINALKALGAWPQEESNWRNRFICAYDYHDESGKLLYQVVRVRTPKSFSQRRRDGAGGWHYNLDGVRRVLYRLPGLVKARALQNGHPPRVYIPEGEKDCDRLVQWGLVTTTNPGGEGKWRAE